MAKEINQINRQLVEASNQIKSAQGFQQLGQSNAAIGQVFQQAFQDVAEQRAAEAGAQQALEGSAPERLLPGFGRAQRAYANAVANTEARQIVLDYQQRAQEEFITASDPANFNANTPKQFAARLNEARAEYINMTRPENRPAVENFITEIQGNLENKMLSRAVDFKNAQLAQNFQRDTDELIRLRRNALFEGDQETVKILTDQIEQTKKDYGVLSNAIQNQMPDIDKRISQEFAIDKIVAGYVQQPTDADATDYMVNFLASGPSKNIPFDIWSKAGSELIKQQSFKNSILSDARAEQNAIMMDGISDGSITTRDEIENFETLTPAQRIHGMMQLDKKLAEDQRRQKQLNDDRLLFISGRTKAIPNERLNKYFDTAIDNFVADNDRYPSSEELANIAVGVGPYTPSGISNLRTNTMIPKYKDMLESQIMSDNPVVRSDGIKAYRYVKETLNAPWAVPLSGDSLDVASLGSELMVSNQPLSEDASREVYKRVTEKDSLAHRQARNEFQKQSVQKELPRIYKEIFGVDYDPMINSEAFAIMRENIYTSFVNQQSMNGAIEATKTKMSAWGTDERYGIKGQIQNSPLSKEYATDDLAYTLYNQQYLALQDAINKSENLEWANKSMQMKQGIADYLINTDENEKVYVPINGETLLSTGVMAKPFKVKVNGVEREIKVQSNAMMNLESNGRRSYSFVYKDQNGDVQPLLGSLGPASFTPKYLYEWAPNIWNSTKEEQVAKQIQRERRQEAIDLVDFKPTDIAGVAYGDTTQLMSKMSQLGYLLSTAGGSEEDQQYLQRAIKELENRKQLKPILEEEDKRDN